MPGSSLGAIIAEIRRRHVVRVASVYAVVAWAVIQVAATVQPYLHLPSWVVTALIVVAVAGLPLALVLAWLFDVTPMGIERTDAPSPARGESGSATSVLASPSATAIASERGRRSAARRSFWFASGVVVALLVAWVAADRYHSGESPVSEGVVAVLPFRVSADPSLGYLREGLVDLLTAKLTGDGGPRALDPRASLVAWRGAGGSDRVDPAPQAELRVAERLGAGRMVTGEIVGTPTRLTIVARLLAVPAGTEQARTEVTGPSDSIPSLIDRLAGQLLLAGVAEPQDRLDALTTTSLPALRAYLDGLVALRAASPDRASEAFARALDLDSTFALAAFHLYFACGQEPDCSDRDRTRSVRLTRRNMSRLSARDRLFASAVLSVEDDTTSPRKLIRALEEVVAQTPESADAWMWLGIAYENFGHLADAPDASYRERAAYERAIELDPNLEWFARTSLILSYGYDHDTRRLRSYAGRVFAKMPERRFASIDGWATAVGLGDLEALQRFRAGLDTILLRPHPDPGPEAAANEAARRELDALVRAAR